MVVGSPYLTLPRAPSGSQELEPVAENSHTAEQLPTIPRFNSSYPLRGNGVLLFRRWVVTTQPALNRIRQLVESIFSCFAAAIFTLSLFVWSALLNCAANLLPWIGSSSCGFFLLFLSSIAITIWIAICLIILFFYFLYSVCVVDMTLP